MADLAELARQTEFKHASSNEVAMFVAQIEDLLDTEYYHSQEARFERWFNRMFKIHQKGVEKIADQGKRLLMPSHRSEIDQGMTGFVIYTHKEQQIIKYFGGANLLVPYATTPLYDNCFLDIRRCGLITYDRGGKKPKAFVEALHFVLHRYDTSYPLWLTFEPGRTKDGLIHDPDIGIFKRACANLGGPITIYPITIDYERVPEDWNFTLNGIFKKLLPKKLAGRINASMDMGSLVKTYLFNNQYNVFFTVGDAVVYGPQLGDDIDMAVKDAASKIIAEQRRNVILTPLPIAYYARTHKLSVEDTIKKAEDLGVNIAPNCFNADYVKYRTSQLLVLPFPSQITYYSNIAKQIFEHFKQS